MCTWSWALADGVVRRLVAVDPSAPPLAKRRDLGRAALADPDAGSQTLRDTAQTA